MAAKRTSRSGIQYQIATTGIFVFGVVALLFFLISWRAMGVPPVSAALFIVLEVLLAWLLNEQPVWLHAGVAVVQILAGVLRGRVPFMILMVLLYAAAYVILQARMDYDDTVLRRKQAVRRRTQEEPDELL